MMAAALLTDEPVVLENVPRIVDVQVMLQMLEGLGVSHAWEGPRLTLHACTIRSVEPAADLSRRVRGSILFAGPLLAVVGRSFSPERGAMPLAVGEWTRISTAFADWGPRWRSKTMAFIFARKGVCGGRICCWMKRA